MFMNLPAAGGQCLSCGSPKEKLAATCERCENTLSRAETSVSAAGYWNRYMANVLDGLILAVLGITAIRILTYSKGVLGSSFAYQFWQYFAFGLYFSWTESSRIQGTLGKLYVGEIVTDLAGDKISFFQAALRYLIKSSPAALGLLFLYHGFPDSFLMDPLASSAILIFGITYGWFIIDSLFIMYTKSHQGIHDMLTGTQVLLVKKKDPGFFLSVFSGFTVLATILLIVASPFIYFRVHRMFGREESYRKWAMQVQLSQALRSGNKGELEGFFKEGVSVNGKLNDGATLLEVASEDDKPEMVTFLLDQGADVNERGIIGTPLHAAAWKGNVDCAELLLQHGADVNSMASMSNETPLMMAAESGQDAMVDFLLKHGADPSIMNQAKETAYDLAKFREFTGVMAELESAQHRRRLRRK